MASNDIAQGKHYKGYTIKPEDVGQPLDPAFIDKAYCEAGTPFTGMQFTMLKKVLRMGKGEKSKEQDLKDIIGAAEREFSLNHLGEPKPWLIDALDNAYSAGVDLLNSMNEPGCNNEMGGLGEHGFFSPFERKNRGFAIRVKIAPHNPEKGFVAALTDELVGLANDPSILLVTNLENIAKEARNEIIDINRGIAPTPYSVIANDNGIEGVLMAVFNVVESLAMELNQHASKAVIAVITENAVFRALDAIGSEIAGGSELQEKHICSTCTRKDLRHACGLHHHIVEHHSNTIECSGYEKVSHA